MENKEIEKAIERIVKTQEKIIGILEKLTLRIKNLEEFSWKGIAEKKVPLLKKGK